MPPLRRISSSLAESGTGSYVFCWVSLASRRVAGSKLNSSPSRASATASGLWTTCRPRLKLLRPHLARRPDRKAIAGDDERLAAVDAGAEVRHQIPERPGLPLLVECLETFRDAVGRRRDLIGVDGVELLRELRAGEAGLVPEDQRLPADEPIVAPGRGRGVTFGQRIHGHARLQTGGFNRVHTNITARGAPPPRASAVSRNWAPTQRPGYFVTRAGPHPHAIQPSRVTGRRLNDRVLLLRARGPTPTRFSRLA